jgi:D-alanyl-D-alanine carboxypeptidase
MTGRKDLIARQAYRLAYQCVVRLHPRVFREQFGHEMTWIFEEATETHGALRLLGDGVISLMRQRVLRPRPEASAAITEGAVAAAREIGFVSWERMNASSSRLPAGRWVHGGLISLALFAAVWLAASQVAKRRPIADFSIDSSSALRTRGITPSGSESGGADSGLAGGSTSGVYAAIKPQEMRERQRPQQLAVQVAAGAQIIPGTTSLAVESQGLVPEVPRTPAGEKFSTWLRSFNSGERAQVEEARKLFKDPPGPNVDGDVEFRRRTGGFDLRRIEESSATRMSGLLQERGSDQFAHFAMVVNANAPHLITEWHLDAVPTPAEFAIGRLSEAQAVEATKARIDELAKDERFSGAVLVTKNGKTLLSGAYGLADREKKVPNSLNTKFRIGSMNKMFTAVSILQLTQAGKIKLNEPFGKYLTDYPNKEASKVTIEQLLTHTGGTGDIFGPEFDQHRKDLKNLQDYVNLYGKRDLEFAPGSRWQYSNYGFLLLGVVVERVSGKSYYNYVRENVYTPAGMNASGSLAEDENVPGRSIGYTSFGGAAVHSNADTLPYRGTSAGGGYSTVEDLRRFASALMNHKLLTAEYTELLTTGKVATPRGSGKYAFGFFDEGADSGARHFGHGGGAPGMNGDLQIYPQSGYVIAVLANLDPPAASRVSEFIANRLPKN